MGKAACDATIKLVSQQRITRQKQIYARILYERMRISLKLNARIVYDIRGTLTVSLVSPRPRHTFDSPSFSMIG